MILRLHGFDFYINIDGCCSLSKVNVNYVRDKDFSMETLLSLIKKFKKLFEVWKRLTNIN